MCMLYDLTRLSCSTATAPSVYGLVRIDHLEGMFHAGRVPWGSIATIRGEESEKAGAAGAAVKIRADKEREDAADDDDPNDNAMDVDEDEDGDEDS